MIFLTLGTQLPFDRLVRTCDEAIVGLGVEVFGQIGRTNYRPKNFRTVDFLTPGECTDRIAAARVVVSHVGVGTILAGLKMEKPLVLMARRAALGEHRNDHQLATAAQLRKVDGVHIVENAIEMKRCLCSARLPAMQNTGTPARDALISMLRLEIFGGDAE